MYVDYPLICIHPFDLGVNNPKIAYFDYVYIPCGSEFVPWCIVEYIKLYITILAKISIKKQSCWFSILPPEEDWLGSDAMASPPVNKCKMYVNFSHILLSEEIKRCYLKFSNIVGFI